MRLTDYDHAAVDKIHRPQATTWCLASTKSPDKGQLSRNENENHSEAAKKVSDNPSYWREKKRPSNTAEWHAQGYNLYTEQVGNHRQNLNYV